DHSGPGEALAAEYVEAKLTEVGISCERYETTSGKRQGVCARIPGTDSSRPALLLHGHLDVVPAQAKDWTYDPFAAEVHDGLIWGRGAVDMKDGDGMILALVRAWARAGIKPPRDIVLQFLPDEEAGSIHGSHWLVDNRKDMFEGVTEAVGEVGGFSLTLRDDVRLYLVQTAEKGIRWMKLRAEGTAGHGSFINNDNAVTRLAQAVAAVGEHKFDIAMTPTVRDFIKAVSDALGIPLSADDPEELLAHLGPIARIIGATLSNTANPTMLNAGYKHNVIPGHAEAMIDGRFLPGFEDELIKDIENLLPPGVVREDVVSGIALEAPFEGRLVDAMGAAIRAEDPSGIPVPYTVSGGTDAKAFSELGITCYGFLPLLLPPELDFSAMFHGVDERVPVAGLEFGMRVMDRFVRSS
ncbi:MAG: M20/M25/M40 family metallo-hydrolase, partial [Actinobacteria bacterium]|nr:M20/M25/M40 family metallo-hydrolase [Actinomycetota bacterium]